jgi:serine/threonine-protein kinase ATR
LIVADSGQINKAMMLLEPVEYDIMKIQELMKKSKSSSDQNSQSRLAAILGCQDFTEEKFHLFAQKLLLSAKLMSTSHIRHGKPIIERYKLALELHPKWEEAAFELGQYYHTLLDLLRKELVAQRSSSISSSSSADQHNAEVYDEKYLGYSLSALDAYLKTVSFGNKHLMQALPRLLTIWFSITGIGRSNSAKESILDRVKKLMTKKMNSAAGQIPAHTWYACMPQIVSRIGHQYPETVNIVKLILIKILGTFPHHGIWHFACLMHSLQQRRQEEGQNILGIASKSVELRSIFEDYNKFFDDLVNLARLQTNSKKITYRIGEGLTHLGKFIVPMQSALTLCYPRHDSSNSSGGADQIEDVVYFPTNQMSILNISNTVDVMNTKAKPKTIQINTTCGRSLRFLVKQEKSGDLRKDARMMEFNGVINRYGSAVGCVAFSLSFVSLSNSFVF